ncbi:hypothetical protein BJ508DRAFT_303316 [Ascobolus immersus RN42]|uniref:Uncharacterized protein n=1 Tax=Ascobolus immersus RN42 TaxID=1160509 RepID=A0A3N4IH17_ASCIM|nr:hypothetical protein BJ508DRAFT_303316 [Ascobolus immersus RN42]
MRQHGNLAGYSVTKTLRQVVICPSPLLETPVRKTASEVPARRTISNLFPKYGNERLSRTLTLQTVPWTNRTWYPVPMRLSNVNNGSLHKVPKRSPHLNIFAPDWTLRHSQQSHVERAPSSYSPLPSPSTPQNHPINQSQIVPDTAAPVILPGLDSSLTYPPSQAASCVPDPLWRKARSFRRRRQLPILLGKKLRVALSVKKVIWEWSLDSRDTAVEADDASSCRKPRFEYETQPWSTGATSIQAPPALQARIHAAKSPATSIKAHGNHLTPPSHKADSSAPRLQCVQGHPLGSCMAPFEGKRSWVGIDRGPSSRVEYFWDLGFWASRGYLVLVGMEEGWRMGMGMGLRLYFRKRLDWVGTGGCIPERRNELNWKYELIQSQWVPQLSKSVTIPARRHHSRQAHQLDARETSCIPVFSTPCSTFSAQVRNNVYIGEGWRQTE